MLPTWLKLTILIWWWFNIIQSLQNDKRSIDTFRTANWSIFCKYLRFIEMTMFQFLVAGIATALWLKLVCKRPIFPDNLNKKHLAFVVFGHIVGSLAVNAAYFMQTWHMKEAIKIWEPVIIFLLLTILGYKKVNDLSCLALFGLLIMAAGSFMFMKWVGKPFNFWGGLASVLSAVAFPLRNVLLKSFGDSWKDPLQKYTVISIYGFLVLLPVTLAKLAYTRIVPLIKPAAVFKSIFQLVDSFISIFVLENISPLFHSVLGTAIQLSVTMVTIVYFHIRLTWHMLAGLSVFVLGLVLYYAKSVTNRGYDLKKNIICIALAFYIFFCAHFFLEFTLKNMPANRENKTTLVRTFWVYNRPLPDDILLNIQTFQTKVPDIHIHVFCATFRCMKKIKHIQNPRIVTSFLTLNDILRNSPLEQWFLRHPWNKVLSKENFENHLHEAVRLALLWHYGGTFVDPFLRMQEIRFQEFKNLNPWISIISDKDLSGVLHLCNFTPRHPFIKILAHSFVTQYMKVTHLRQDNSGKFVLNFHKTSLKAFLLFCNETEKHCPKKFAIKANKLVLKADEGTHHFGIISEKSNLNFGIENFVAVQFFPFVDSFLGNNHKNSYNTTAFVNFGWKDIESKLQFLGILDSIMLSVSIDFQKIPSRKYIEFFRRRAPIGCLDTETVNFLRNNMVDAYLSGGILPLVKSPFLSGISRNNVYLIDVHDAVKKQLPLNIQRDGIQLDYGKAYNLKLKQRSGTIAAYDLIKKYSSARLIITQNAYCASIAVAMNTPVLFINSTDTPRTKEAKSLQHFKNPPEIFHILDASRLSENATVMFLKNFIYANPPNPNPSLFMRLRATTWNAIRKHKSLHESALRFGIVPFSRPVFHSSSDITFHLIFTTSNRSSIVLEGQNSGNKVKGGFMWRHWRCVEAIFYHHPFAKVVIHSNSLSLSTFDVLTEAAYDIKVKSYSLVDLARGTPAEMFVQDELPYAKEGEHWYSHETDLLRLLVLFKWGGVYMDTDIIFVRALDDLPSNVLAWESGYNMNGAFLKFQKGHPFLETCIKKFSEHYSQAWSENGPLLISRAWREWSRNHNENDIHTVSRKAFYMFYYRTIEKQCFEDTEGDSYISKWNILRNEAYAVHLYSKVTAEYGTKNKKIKEGTLCKYILNSFCVLCNNMY